MQKLAFSLFASLSFLLPIIELSNADRFTQAAPVPIPNSGTAEIVCYNTPQFLIVPGGTTAVYEYLLNKGSDLPPIVFVNSVLTFVNIDTSTDSIPDVGPVFPSEAVRRTVIRPVFQSAFVTAKSEALGTKISFTSRGTVKVETATYTPSSTLKAFCFPEPPDDDIVQCPTPSPTAAAATQPVDPKTAGATVSATATPTPSPSPCPTPSPTPSPTPTPTPTPTPSPAPTPTPSPTPSPAQLQTLVNFNGANGANPTSLTLGPDGNFYGMTYDGGPDDAGTVFRVTPDGQLTTLHNFSGPDGDGPNDALTLGRDDNFYGTTWWGGSSDVEGTVFRITPSGQLTTLVNFFDDFNVGSNGENPLAGLTLGRDGNFYGTTSDGNTVDDGNSDGTVFRVTPDGQLTTLYNFSGPDGDEPTATLTLGNDGNLYGTTRYGGSTDNGTVFSITPSGQFKSLVNFNGTNGKDPYVSLTLGRDGNFYGTTPTGGASNLGTVFRMTPGGQLTTLVNFTGANGAVPVGKLTLGNDGNFYGTTAEGGDSNFGTVFRMTADGQLTTLFKFNGDNGDIPSGQLIFGSDGSLYGTTSIGGSSDDGTVFKLTLPTP